MVAKNITGEIRLFVEDVVNRAVEEANPNREEQERLLARKTDLQASFVSSIRLFMTETSSCELALNILGKDFVSPEDIARARNMAYTKEQLAKFHETVPSKEVLGWCCDQGYVLIAGPDKPLSLAKIRDMHFSYFEFTQGGWSYQGKNFASNDLVGTKWIILRKNPLLSSVNLKWEEQNALLSNVEFVPNVAEVAWAVTTYKSVRDVYLLKNIFVRTSSADSGEHICLSGGGPVVVYKRDNERHPDLGLAVARKLF